MNRKIIIILVVVIALLGFGAQLYFEDFYHPSTLVDTSNKSQLGQVRDWMRSLIPKSEPENTIPPPVEPLPPLVYDPPKWPASSTIDRNLRNQLPKE